MFLFFIIRHTLAGTDNLAEEQKKSIAELEKNIIKRKAQLYEIEQSLPQKNGLYLKVRSKKYKWTRVCNKKYCLYSFSDHFG